MSRAVLKAVGLAKSYPSPGGKIVVLQDINLEVRQGEMVHITGPSGSGKTTLLGCLSGLLAPDAGHVLFHDKSLPSSDSAKARLRREHMAFVFQTGNLLPYLTAVQNAALALILKGTPQRKALDMASRLLTEFGLGERLRHYPERLSGGEQQRVAVARAALSGAEVLLADEPTGNLDDANSRQLAEHLAGLRHSGCAVVVVSHDPMFRELADITVRLRGGRLEVG
ncbi:MAG TPA: hypothetical protein DGR79_05285 [Clostridiales bacterium]|nr:hypothetical protein [Clostridiales bacterium]